MAVDTRTAVDDIIDAEDAVAEDRVYRAEINAFLAYFFAESPRPEDVLTRWIAFTEATLPEPAELFRTIVPNKNVAGARKHIDRHLNLAFAGYPHYCRHKAPTASEVAGEVTDSLIEFHRVRGDRRATLTRLFATCAVFASDMVVNMRYAQLDELFGYRQPTFSKLVTSLYRDGFGIVGPAQKSEEGRREYARKRRNRAKFYRKQP